MGQSPPVAVDSYRLTLNPNVYSVAAGNTITLRGSFNVSGAVPGGAAAVYSQEDLFGLDPTSPHLTLVAGNITQSQSFNGPSYFEDQISGGGYLGPTSFTGPTVTAISDLRTFLVPAATQPGAYHYSYGVVFEPVSGPGFFDTSLTIIVSPAAQKNAIPTIDQPLIPTSIAPGAPGFTMTVNGANFAPGAVVKWNGSSRASHFVSPAQLTSTVLASDVANVSTASISVVNPSGGGTSNAVQFPIANRRSTVTFTRTDLPGAQIPAGLAGGDLNRDGALDLIVSNVGDDTVSVFLGDGRGSFSAKQDYSTGITPGTAAVGDFNGDGVLDLAVPSSGCAITAANCVNPPGSVSILIGKGDGTFRSHVDYRAGIWTTAVMVGDFNGDGKLDVIAVNGTCPGAPCSTTSSTISVLMGNGDGTFQPPVNYTVGLRPVSGVVGDFNGDGILDVAVSNDFDATVSALLGNGDGTFQSQKVFPIGVPPVVQGGGVRPAGIVAADFNNDGKLDLAVANEVGNTLSIFLGNGDGTFKPEVDYSTDQDPQLIAVGDFNGDGIVDIVLTNSNSNTISLYFGNGDGSFQPQVTYAIAAQPDGVVSADLNGDGQLDIAVAAEGGNGAPTGTISAFLTNFVNPCSYSLSPSGQGFSTAGGLGSLTVATASTCNWSAVPSANWISIFPGGNHGTAKVNYAVAANGGPSRTGTISVGGQKYNIDQTGFGCSYSISPTFASPGDSGGNVVTSVSAPRGCPWTAVSSAPWLTVNSGASGSGAGTIVINVGPNNTGASRSGFATIAGRPFSVTQGAGACGALDVTSQIGYFPSRFIGFPPLFNIYHQDITIINQSGSAINGPLYLVLEGLPTANGAGPSGGFPFTYCFSSKGDSRVYLSPGLSAGASLKFGIDFVLPLGLSTNTLNYTPKLLSGTPSK